MYIIIYIVELYSNIMNFIIVLVEYLAVTITNPFKFNQYIVYMFNLDVYVFVIFKM